MSSRRLRQALRHVVPSPVPGADAGDDPSHRNAQALRCANPPAFALGQPDTTMH
eukprot:COSAG05_NODE_7_length_42457_cov_58.929152_8_plen_54_part_00